MIGHLTGKKQWVFEVWADNGASITSASIPGTTFDLGTGNGSYASATTPVALNFDDTATGADKYLFYVSHNGVRKTAADGVTFSQPTITMPSSVAVSSTLLVIYAMDVTSVLPPHGQANSSADSYMNSWQTFQG